MSVSAKLTDGIAGGRLPADAYAKNFGDLHKPLTQHEAFVEANRCYFCHDAPCITACPTEIDIPLFIRQISTGTPKSAAKTILAQNILGGMCARVCPTETLCEEACVREFAEGKPVKIGELQRYATDEVMRAGDKVFSRAASTGKKVAVVGSGPAGLAAAHRLALHGHDVTILEARDKTGGLNEYGIATYKVVDAFAAREIEFILSIGGIKVETGKALGRDFSLDSLTKNYDAVFLGMGLAGVNALGSDGEKLDGVIDAVDFISKLRQAKDYAKVPVGRRVVVIGGGMTAIDAGVQSKLLGAEEVTIAYRRGAAEMKASAYEQDLAKSKGVVIRHWVKPARIMGAGGKVTGIELEYTAEKGGKLTLQADMVMKAIGQTYVDGPLGARLTLDSGRIKVDAERRTSLPKVWAGGDCIAGGEDLTVSAVADGRDAAESIHRVLSA